LLESLARQTLLPYELVAHDDASEDATVSLLEAFAREAPFEVRNRARNLARTSLDRLRDLPTAAAHLGSILRAP
jgi:glycosyltransferase involved in cell wall biosynthesis